MAYCHKCTKVFGWRESLYKHIKRHHSNKEDDFILCGERQCRQKFKTVEELNDHMKHHEIKKCNRKYHRAPKCEVKHDTMVDAISGKIIYKCDKCPKLYIDGDSLTKHKIRQHGQGLLIKCQKCDKTFTKPNSLVSHMKSYHTGDKAHLLSCAVKFCRHRFETQQMLDIHMEYHKKGAEVTGTDNSAGHDHTYILSEDHSGDDEALVAIVQKEGQGHQTVENLGAVGMNVLNKHSDIQTDQTPEYTAYKLVDNNKADDQTNTSAVGKCGNKVTNVTVELKKNDKPKVLLVRRSEQRIREKVSDEELIKSKAIELSESAAYDNKFRPKAFMLRISRDDNDKDPASNTS